MNSTPDMMGVVVWSMPSGSSRAATSYNHLRMWKRAMPTSRKMEHAPTLTGQVVAISGLFHHVEVSGDGSFFACLSRGFILYISDETLSY